MKKASLMYHQPNKSTITEGSVPGVMANPSLQGFMFSPVLHGGRNTVSQFCSQNVQAAQSKRPVGDGLLPDPLPNWPAKVLLGDGLLPDPVPNSFVKGWPAKPSKNCLASDGKLNIHKRMSVDTQCVASRAGDPGAKDPVTMTVTSSSDSSEATEREQNQHPAGLHVSESCESASTSLMDGVSQCTQPTGGVLPDILAEQHINRINYQLNALDVRFNQLLNGCYVKTVPGDRRTQMKYFQKERRRLKKELRKEIQQQHMQNLQLSYQLQQEYKVSLGSHPCELTLTERKQRQDEETIDKLLNDYAQLNCEISNLNFKIEDLQSEERELTPHENQEQKDLVARKNLLEQKAKLVQKSRTKLLRQTAMARMGIVPWSLLIRLRKDIKMWRDLRHAEINLAEENQPEMDIHLPMESEVMEEELENSEEIVVNMTKSKTVQATSNMKPVNDEEVVVVSDEEEQSDTTKMSSADLGKSALNTKLPQQQSWLSASERRCLKRKKVVRDIDMCVKESKMMADADQSHFLLSGLVNVLFTRQRNRKLGHPHHQTHKEKAPATLSQGETSAVCLLIRQITNKLELTSNHEAKIQQAQERNRQQMLQREERERVDMYLKVHKESS